MTFLDVLHVLKMRKNLMSEHMLRKKGFKLLFESDKFVLTKGGMFVEKGYLSEGLFKVNYIPKFFINENIMIAFLILLSLAIYGILY